MHQTLKVYRENRLQASLNCQKELLQSQKLEGQNQTPSPMMLWNLGHLPHLTLLVQTQIWGLKERWFPSLEAKKLKALILRSFIISSEDS